MELDTFRFKLTEFLTPVRHWPKYDLTSKRHVRCTPQTLYTLCSFVKDDFPMLSHFKWSNAEVLEWIERLGYPQYKTTFRENLINGRTLLLVDASALCHMNIKDFEHIKEITKAIRQMYRVEKVLFNRSISLPYRLPGTEYKLYRVCTGAKYERKSKSHFWNEMGIVQNKRVNENHWEALTERLQHTRYDQKHRIGLTPVHTLYKVRKASQPKSVVIPQPIVNDLEWNCNCIPPCECRWRESYYRGPWLLNCLVPVEALINVTDFDVVVLEVDAAQEPQHQITSEVDVFCGEPYSNVMLDNTGSGRIPEQCWCMLPHDCNWLKAYMKPPRVMQILRLNEEIIRDFDLTNSTGEL